MSKRPSLFAVKPTIAVVNDPQPEASADIAVAPPVAAKTRARSREGKRVLSVYLT
jgi:hypothetical protein